MYAQERYLTLLGRFSGDTDTALPVEATLENIAAALFCTPRNAKHILRRLEDEGLIRWLPGRGRGHRSQIAFLADKREYLLELLRSLAGKGDYKQAFELLEGYGNEVEKAEFMAWLDGSFGYRKEQGEGGAYAADTLRFPVVSSFSTFDPAQINYALDGHLARQIYDRLLQFDDLEQVMLPGAAHHWTSSDDAREWTFFLKKGIRFHHGPEMTSADVKFTFDRLRASVDNGWLMRGVDEIETIGPRVVRFRLRRPNHIFSRFVCAAAASLLPAGFGGRSEQDFWKLPSGSGPFRMIHASDSCVELAAHPSYHQGRPYLDGVDIVIMPKDFRPRIEGTPEIFRPRDGLGKSWAGEHASATADWLALQKLCRGCTLLSWNLQRSGPQQSEAFRRAVKMILDPVQMVADLGGDRALPAYSFLPDVSMARTPEPPRTERIRAALRDSEYAGSPLRLTANPKYAEDVQWIQKRLQEWGIALDTRLSPTASCRNLGTPETDVTVFGLVLADDEVDEIEAYEHGGCVMSNYFDEERRFWIRERVDAALAESLPERRSQIMRQIEEQLRDEASLIFLHHQQLQTYLHPSVQGARLNTLGWIDFKEVWLESCLDVGGTREAGKLVSGSLS